MANNIIKIKRSTGNSAPSSLNAGELAFTGGAGTQGNNGQRLFIGDPANSNAVTVIGGNYFTNLMDHAHGTTTASSVLIVDGNKSTSELRTPALHLGTSGGDTLVTSTAAELNIVDGGTSATSTTLVDADRVVVNDNGVMKQVALTDFETYFESALDTLSNVTSVGTLTALSVDNITLNTNTISTTNSNGDLILAPNGTGNVAMTTDTLSVTATEGESATLLLSADESDDNGDDWSFVNSTANTLTINNDISGSAVAQITLTPNATVASSTTAIAGNTTVGGTLDVTGVISPTTHVDMPDDAKVKLGTGDDLELHHDGTDSFIDNKTGTLKIATATSGVPVSIGHTTSEVTVNDNLTVTGDLTVSGTTTTVNSTTVSIADPIFELGSSSSDDNLDRGFKMKYNSSGAKIAFMGFDDSDGKFVMIPDATDTNSVFTGSIGVLKANIETGNTGLVVGGSTPFSDDGSGSLTLQNVDAIDATTENTLEAAIDSLTNLTAVGTLTTGTWNATTIAIGSGGTGLNAVGTSGQLLVSNGSALVYQDIDGGTFS
tara:strand:- start:952 stop:2592 length:1641 start_codon:yes stop_codon:yes gene_type:complete